MPLSSTQIETWGHHPQTQTAVNSHQAIRNAILSHKVWLQKPDIFLQGSYANDTNTYRDHDVDVVVQANEDALFRFDIDLLPQHDKDRFREQVSTPCITLEGFREEIIGILRNRFGWSNVTVGNKAIKITGESGQRLDADVVICKQYRKFITYTGTLSEGYIEGISFIDGNGREITNYPKLHKYNGIWKQEETRNWFKRTVRVFKNARSYLVDNGLLEYGVAPSYFIQGLLYNVDHSAFGNNHHQNFNDVLWSLVNNQDSWQNFRCQNGIDDLFGDTPEQWDMASALKFVIALMKLNE